MPDETPTPLVLFDGRCPFCHGVVRWILRHDHRRIFRIAPLEHPQAQRLLATQPDVAGVDSVVLLTRPARDAPLEALVRSVAVLRILREVGGVWRMVAAMGRVVPRRLADAMYDAFARRRALLFGRYDACPLPAPADRDRFLGDD